MSQGLSVQNLYKIFGPDPKAAMRQVEAGRTKDEIFDETGMTVGVRDASFEVRPGEIFVVMGLSGSGKSTLIRMLNRLIEPTAGHILIGERDLTRMSTAELIELRRHEISMVFQSFALMPHKTVLENASFGLEVAGVDADERAERALKTLDAVGLKANAESYPDELSGGMKQRVGLARALTTDPSIMLMDEAFSALDPLIRAEMQDELLRLQEESERTVVFISHDLDEALRIGDRIAIMQGGAIVQVGTPEEVLRAPANDYVRSFFRGVDVSQVFTAGDVAREELTSVIERQGAGVRAALKLLQDQHRDFGVVVDRQRHYRGMISAETLARLAKRHDGTDGGDRLPQEAFLDGPDPVLPDKPIAEVLGLVAESPYPVPVVDEKGRYVGAISKTALLQTLDREAEDSPSSDEAAA